MMAASGPTGEPTEDAGRSWKIRYNVAWVGVMMGLFGPIQILLPNQIQAIAPGNKESTLAWVFASGALFSLIANPLWGALSDRTTSRHGRRLPWIAGGVIVGALGLTLLGMAVNVTQVIIAWCLVQTAVNAPWAALTAALPDQVPPSKRGAASGYLGLAQVMGMALAAGVATVAPGVAGYAACGAAMTLSVIPFLLLRQDIVLASLDRPRWNLNTFVRGFWINPARYPDFGWAWLTRFLINLSNSVALTYLLYFLRDGLRVPDAELGVLTLGAVNVVGIVAAVVVSGSISDRTGRRKAFVIASGAIMAVAVLLISASPTWSTTVFAAFVLGIGFGIYTAVDFALITQVLPQASDRGKDMGVLSVASSMPQVLAPVIAAPIVTSIGGYPMLFAVSAVIAILGAAFVIPIRSVS